MPARKIPEWEKALRLLKEHGAHKTPRPARGPQAFGYTRVSHADSVDRGTSLPAQADIIWTCYRLLVRDKETDLGPVLAVGWGGTFQDEAKSAWTIPLLERPEGGKLCRALRPGDHVIFAYLDRGFRNLRDTLATVEGWKDRDIYVHFCNFPQLSTDTAEGWLMLSFQATLAEYFSRAQSDRIKAGLARRKQKFHGRIPLGQVPYGMRRVGRGKRKSLVVDQQQIEWGNWIVEMRDDDNLTWKAIAAACNERVLGIAVEGGENPFLKWRDKLEWLAERVRRWHGYEMTRRQKIKDGDPDGDPPPEPE